MQKNGKARKLLPSSGLDKDAEGYVWRTDLGVFTLRNESTSPRGQERAAITWGPRYNVDSR